ncbi:MAG: Ig-like domain-containing protein, partial [Magnetococcus sp. DMHC-1]
ITSLSSGNGVWQFNNGAGWTDVGVVSANSALLLRSTDSIRFVPDGQNADSATFTYQSWDQTSGASGTKVDASVNGGTTAFSTASDTATITVTAVNDAPVLAAAAPTLTTISEDATGNAGDTVAALLGASSADVDTGAVNGIAMTSLTSGNGVWQYNTGTGWTDVGVVSANSALLLRSTDSIRFVPDGQNADSATFTYQSWDQTSGASGTKVDASVSGGTTAFSTASDTATITVTAVNDAPVLDATATTTLTTINEDAITNTGDTVAALLGAASTDVDTGAVSGIAITSLNAGNGVWQYNTGAGWTDVGAVSDSSALLLGSTDSIRFVPNGDNAETPSFGFRAWDQSSDAIGSKVDVSTNGDTTAFSVTTHTATLTVTAVNDAPVLTAAAPTLTTITEDATGNAGDTVAAMLGASTTDVDGGAVEGIAITSLASGNGIWQYNTGSGWTDVGAVSANSALLLRSTDAIRFVPDGQNADSATFTYRAWDQASGLAGAKVDTSTHGGITAFSNATDTASITVTAVNDTPMVTPGADSAYVEGGPAILVAPGISLMDVDSGELLTGATITITGHYQSGQDVLGFANTGNISGHWDAATGTLTLTGSDTVANYQAALRQVTFTNLSQDPTAASAERTLQFVVKDSFSTSDPVTNVVHLTAVDNAPIVTTPNTLTVVEGSTAILNGTYLQLADPDNTPEAIQLTLTHLPDGGQVLLNGMAMRQGDSFTGADLAAGRIAYHHTGGEAAQDQFTLLVKDSGGASAGTTTVHLNVTNTNDAPVVTVPDALSADEDQSLSVGNIRISDADAASSDILAVTLSDFHGNITLTHTTGLTFTMGENGQSAMRFEGTTANLNAALASLVYQGQTDWNGSDVLNIQVEDRNSSSPQWAGGVISIHVRPVEDTPIAGMDALTTTENTPLDIEPSIDLLNNDLDPDQDTLILGGFSQGLHGQVILNSDSTFTYIPNHNFTGLDRFSYTLEDAAGNTATAIVTVVVNPINDGLHAETDFKTTQEDRATVIANPLANDWDAKYATNGGHNPALQIIGFTGAEHGQVTYNADGTFSYRPNADYVGQDRFTYTLSDGSQRIAQGEVVLDVTPVNDAPVVGLDTFMVKEGQPLTIRIDQDLLANDTDVDGDALKIIGFSQPAHGTIQVNPDNTLTYVPSGNFHGQDSFTYTLSDGQGYLATTTAQVFIGVQPVVEPLQVRDDVVSTREGRPIIVANVLANDADPDHLPAGTPNPAMKVSGFSAAAHGTVVYQQDGSFIYRPNAGFSGTDQFTYMARTPDGRFGTATVRITVDPLQNSDQDTDVDAEDSTPDQSPINFNLSADAFKDVLTPGSPVTYTTSGMPQWLTFDPDNLSFSGFATRDDAGVYSITVTATDATGLSASGNFELTVANSSPNSHHHHAHNANGDAPRFVVKQSLMEVALNKTQGQGYTESGAASSGKSDGPVVSLSGTELLTTWRSENGPTVRLSQSVSGTQLIATTRQNTDGYGSLSSQNTSGTQLITRVRQEAEAAKGSGQVRAGDGQAASGKVSGTSDSSSTSDTYSVAGANQEAKESGGSGKNDFNPVAANMATRERSSTGVAVDTVTGVAASAAKAAESHATSQADKQTEAAWSRARQSQANAAQDAAGRVAQAKNANNPNAAQDASDASDANNQQDNQLHTTAEVIASSVLGGRLSDDLDPRSIAAKERKAGSFNTRPGLTRQLQSSHQHGGSLRLSHGVKR